MVVVLNGGRLRVAFSTGHKNVLIYFRSTVLSNFYAGNVVPKSVCLHFCRATLY